MTADKPFVGGSPLMGVIGHPIGHSLSPLLHGAALRHLGIGGTYLAFDVTDVAGAMAGMRALAIRGLSVTIPHKETVMAHLDELDPLAARIGAVNTVVNDGGRLKGYNSDCLGAMAALEAVTSLAGKTAAVIGAGGASRAIVVGLADRGARPVVVNRSVERGESLARDLGAPFTPLAEFRPDGVDILVNATPVGMSPRSGETPISPDSLRPGMVVMDIVYNPLETRLLREATAAGCRVVDGLAMFVGQGAVQFELYTGHPAPVGVMREAVLAALTRR